MIQFMKPRWGSVLVNVGLLTLASVLVDGCATSRPAPTVVELKRRGPVIMNPKSVPERIELTETRRPLESQYITAEIVGVGARVTDARVQIANTPVVIPLERAHGTYWIGSLTPEQIAELSINGRSIKYVGRVIARDQSGVVNIGRDPLVMSIDTPPLT